MTQLSAEASEPQQKKLFNPTENLAEAENPNSDIETTEDTFRDRLVDNDQIDDLRPELSDTGENIDKDKKNRIKNIGIAVVTAAGAVIVAGAVLISSLGGNKNKEPKATNDNLPAGFTDTTSASEEVGSETTIIISEDTATTTGSETTAAVTIETEKGSEAQIDYSKPPIDVVEGYSFESLSEDKKAEIKKLDDMSIEEFQALPQTEQDVFNVWILENYGPRADFLMEKNNIDLKYTYDPKTPQEYADNYAWMTTFATILYECPTPDSGLENDTLTGQKVMSLRDVSSAVHNAANNSYVNRFKDGASITQIDISVTAYKEIDNGMILNMHQDSTPTITVEAGAEDGQRTFIKVPVEMIDGTEEIFSETQFAVPINDPQVVSGLTPVS